MSTPYASPKANLISPENKILKKAKSPKVIGIILLILSIFNTIFEGGTLVATILLPNIIIETQKLEPTFSTIYIWSSLVFSVILSLWLFYISIQLIKYKDKGRKHLNAYIVLCIITSISTRTYQATLPAASFSLTTWAGPLFYFVISLLFFSICYYFLNKKQTKASLS